MAFKYENVVPWGRSYAEYVRMFKLCEADLGKSILGCGDGPASFNAVCNARGGNVISIDPIYALTRGEIEQRIADTYASVIGQTEKNRDKFKWDVIRSVEELGQVRMVAMREFLDSYEEGKRRQVYVPASLPELPFPDGHFHLALCSHLLFLYSDNLSQAFHAASIREMLRVAREVRIFPLLDVNAKRSAHLDGVLGELSGVAVDIQTTEYEFQIGGNEVLILRGPQTS